MFFTNRRNLKIKFNRIQTLRVHQCVFKYLCYLVFEVREARGKASRMDIIFIAPVLELSLPEWKRCIRIGWFGYLMRVAIFLNAWKSLWERGVTAASNCASSFRELPVRFYDNNCDEWPFIAVEWRSLAIELFYSVDRCFKLSFLVRK